MSVKTTGIHLLSWLLVTIGCAAVVVMVGCAGGRDASAGPTSQPTNDEFAVAPITNTDPCAMRLHDLAGRLALYWGFRGRLPDTLDELAEIESTMPMPELVCPQTGTAYLYNPGGIYLPETENYILVYDPAPVHAGLRWAIIAKEPDETGVFVAKVVPVPERVFSFR